MPARRPYAYRGVPRRAQIGRPGNARLATGRVALVSLLVLIAAGAIWVMDPFASARQTAARAVLFATNDGASTSITAPNVADSSASVLQMAEVATGAAALGSSAGVLPTASPMVRAWQNDAAGVISDPVLARRLDEALVGVDGHLSVAVKDLGSGRGALLDGDRELQAASLYKLPILYAVFEAGLNMSEELPITEDARAFDTGTLELGVGESLSVAEALERMVTVSDNTAAVMLGSRVGSARVSADLAALGMESTHYSLERMTTSASDMLRYLDLLAQGKLVSPSASADMLHLMLRQRVNDRLPRLLPAGVEVAHKTGNLPGTVNDVGIIYGPSSTVAVAALISDTTDETAAASGIAQLALAAVNYFEQQPEDASRPTIPRAPTRPIPPVWRGPRQVPTLTRTPVPVDQPIVPAVDGTRASTINPPAPEPADTSATPSLPTLRPTPAPAPPTPRPGSPLPTSTPPPPAAMLGTSAATAVSVPPTRPPPRATLPATPMPPVKR